MQNQPYTELIGGISNKLNPKAIEQDIQLLKTLPSINAFSDYWVGTVRVYTLWNMNGDNEEGYYAEYCGAAQVTKTGLKLNYINEILSNTFHLDFLKFARIFELENGGFLLPHRDYLELENGFSRLNIPIKTNEKCFYSEDLVVYHMGFGEIWFVNNVQKVHSAINFSSKSRLHLILDFDCNIPLTDLFKDKSAMTLSVKPKWEHPILADSRERSIFNSRVIAAN